MTNDDSEFQPLTPDELRETGVILPELNGLAMWMKPLECEFCGAKLETHVIALQKVQRSALNFMCIPCARELFRFRT